MLYSSFQKPHFGTHTILPGMCCLILQKYIERKRPSRRACEGISSHAVQNNLCACMRCAQWEGGSEKRVREEGRKEGREGGQERGRGMRKEGEGNREGGRGT